MNMNRKTIRETSSSLLIFVSFLTGYSITKIISHHYFWFSALIPSVIFIIWHFYNLIKSHRPNE